MAGAPQRREDQPLRTVLHPKTADAVKRHLGLETVGEVLEYFPRRYLPRGELTRFSDLVLGQEVSIISRILSVSTRRLHTRRGAIAEVTVTDQLAPAENDASKGQGNFAPRLDGLAGVGLPVPDAEPIGDTMTLSFFNAWTASKDLAVGDHVMFSGKVNEYRGQLTLTNPHYAVLEDPAPGDASGDADVATAPLPVYPATAKFTTDRIASVVGRVLDTIDLALLEDPVPDDLRTEHHLMSLPDALEAVHRPRDEDEPHQAMRYFRYREALVLQTLLARRSAVLDAQKTRAFPPRDAGLRERFDQTLPFRLTDGQRRVGDEIADDIALEKPMNRLLQGDVGSGKTLVALRAMLQVADVGGQSAMLAPTEVLASQHYRSVLKTLGPIAEEVGVVVLTSSMTAGAKRQALLDIASGGAGIVIGTHALLGDDVAFAELGLVVVDEQHRFGVRQRHSLTAKDGVPVHRLVMTATPIPRSVAMTVFGDLAVSVLNEMPAGRQDVSTHVVSLAEHPTWETRLWERAREEIDAGHQVFVVVPTIGEDAPEPGLTEGDGGQETQLQSVEGMVRKLSGLPVLSGIRLGSVHGRMDGADKADVMNRMAAGSVDLLVATTVIEVGVDVPNASLMIIMDADRLGISTLHQLRGRIGRGELEGVCLLVTGQDHDGPSMPRLQAVASTRDGFELSTLDLEQRREGDILGDNQSGRRSTLKNLSVLRHVKTIEQARDDAWRLVDREPDLSGHPSLLRAVQDAGEQSTTEYLYRG